jgi:hypothetical protein
MRAGCVGTGLAVPAGAASTADADARADAAEVSATVPAVAAALLVRNWRLSTGNLLVH